MTRPDARLDGPEFERFAALVREASGMDVLGARRADLERVLAARMAEHRLTDLAAFDRLLADPARGPAEARRLVAALTVGETYFFRDRPQFDALERRALPEILARKATTTRTIRAWCAGCSTGEEPYSVAIVLDRLLAGRPGWDARVIATDLNPRALDAARRAAYGAWSFRQAPPDLLAAYFVAEDGRQALIPRVRERVTFAVDSLVGPDTAATSNVDILFCRNVMIYFDPESSRRVAARLVRSLAPGGWLFVAPAEATGELFRGLEPVALPGTIAFRKSEPGDPPSAVRSIRHFAPAVPAPPPTPIPLPVPTPAPEPPPAPAAPGSPDEVRALFRDRPEAEVLAQVETALAGPLSAADRARLAGWAAACLADRGRPEAALGLVERSIAWDPLSAPAHHLQGLVLLELGRRDEALAALRRSLFVEPGFALGHFAMARLLDALGEPDRAGAHLANVERLLAGRPRDEPVEGGDGLTVGALLGRVDQWRARR